jgi:hypothetical protein
VSAIIWHVWVDWNNDGVYESDEGARLIAARIERGRDGVLDDPNVGVCSLTLQNADRRYDSWYAASPLYPHVGAGKRVQVSIDHAGSTHKLFTGRIDTPRVSGIRAAGTMGRARTAEFEVHDGWQWLKDQRVNVELQQDQDTRTVLQAILQAAGWIEAQGLWILGSGILGTSTVLGGMLGDNTDLGLHGGDVIPYYWMEDEEVAQNIFGLVDSHFGRIQINADGTLLWRTIAGDNGAPIDLTLTDAVLQEMEAEQTWADVKDRVEITANPRTLSVVADIWNSETIAVQIGETREIYAEYTNSNGDKTPATSIITPIAGIDYVANSAADGSGTDLTSSISIIPVIYSFKTQLLITNYASVPVYLTTLKLRGQLIETLDSQTAVAEELNVTKRTLTRDLRWQQSFLAAQDLADWALGEFSQAQDVLQLRFEHSSIAMQHDLGTKILDATTQGTGGKFRIGKISQETIDEHCQQLVTTWTCFRIPPDDYWKLGDGSLSQMGQSTKLGI